MNDTIYRQEAIDALVKRTNLTWENLKIIHPFLDVFEKLPSAERWTLITDELPEIGDRALVTIPSIGETFVTIGTYAGEHRWYIDDYGFCEKVIAWLSLPEPYKESKQNE